MLFFSVSSVLSVVFQNPFQKIIKSQVQRAKEFIDSREKTPLLVAGMNPAPRDLSTIPSLLSSRSMGRLAGSRERTTLSRVKSQEHELKHPYVGTDCVELTPVDMETLMVEAGSPVACSGEEVTSPTSSY